MGNAQAQDQVVERVDNVSEKWAMATVTGKAGTRRIAVRRHSMFPERPRPAARPEPKDP